MNIIISFNKYYKYGFKTNLNSLNLLGGLNQKLLDNIYILSSNFKILNTFRVKALYKLSFLRIPDWVFFEIPDINYDHLIYYSSPININNLKITNILTNTFKNLGFNIEESFKLNIYAIDFIFDSISVIKTITPFLIKSGIIFNSLFESLIKYIYIIIKYLGTVIPIEDNFYTTLNSIVFSEGSFCYIPKDILCEFNLSTYFRTNTENYAQFERTLLIVNNNSSVCYLEGCTAPVYKETQLHVAVVEIIVKNYSNVKYITVQNWFSGNILGEGGLYNFTTKRGLCFDNSYLSWLQIEMGSSITWKYPSTILKGNCAVGDFYSISFISELQIADTGTKVLHLGNFTKSKVLSKSISFDISKNIYRGLIKIIKVSFNSINKTECDSLLLGKEALTVTIPYSKIYNYTSNVQQEAFISKIDEIFLFILMQRGLCVYKALTFIVNGFCTVIYNKLPLEFISEIPKLIFLKTKNLFNN